MSVFGSLVTRAALPFTAALALHATAGQMAMLGAADLIASLAVSIHEPAMPDTETHEAIVKGVAAQPIVTVKHETEGKPGNDTRY